jgi:hypothetical protein
MIISQQLTRPAVPKEREKAPGSTRAGQGGMHAVQVA